MQVSGTIYNQQEGIEHVIQQIPLYFVPHLDLKSEGFRSCSEEMQIPLSFKLLIWEEPCQQSNLSKILG